MIGDDNVIREYVSIQRGTMKEWDTKQGQTRIGSRNLIMNYCHVAHDCVLGNDIIMANNASLAGHVEIGDFVGLGGTPWSINSVASVRMPSPRFRPGWMAISRRSCSRTATRRRCAPLTRPA